MRYIVLALALLLAITTTSAQETITRETTLLAVSQAEGETYGSTATLSVEVLSGKGRVFIETHPLTKLDTQVSTRLAKEIACQYANVDCSNLDFIYTIRSESPIIGGASAGAPITVLTVAALLDLPIKKEVALTGTINTGGIVGAVGGIKQKIEATIPTNINTILIPSGERYVFDEFEPLLSETSNSSNRTMTKIDTYILGATHDKTVQEIATIDEAVYAFTGQRPFTIGQSFEIPEFYTENMKNIATQMCSRAKDQKKELMQKNAINLLDVNASPIDISNANTLLERATNASAVSQFYAQASFCFGASIRLQTQILQDATPFEIVVYGEELLDKLSLYQMPQVRTITDLQTYMLVNERVIESTVLANQSLAVAYNNTDSARQSLAYAIERYESAMQWASFFGMPGRDADINAQRVQSACNEKLTEAEERRQYVALYIPSHLEARDADLDEAYTQRSEQNYELCLFYASLGKASYDLIIGALGIQDENATQSALDIKQYVAADAIARQAQLNIYPIISYSFIEYADSLQESDVYSALLYSQNALEIADITKYFIPQSEYRKAQIEITRQEVLTENQYLLLGVAIGLILAGLAMAVERRIIFRKKPTQTHTNTGSSRKKR